MTAGDIGAIVTGVGIIAAFVDCATGLQITRALWRLVRGKTPNHLRGRKPMECGVGTPSGTQLREVVRVTRVRRSGVGDSLDGWDDVVLEAMDKERREQALMANRLPAVREQVGLANARAFQQRHQDAQVSPLDQARLSAWGAALNGSTSIALPLEQYRAALEHYFTERKLRAPDEKPHLYGVRLTVKAV